MSTVTYRPNGAGTNTGITTQYPASTAHYDKVDEESADDWTTYIQTTSTSYQVDTYAIANPAERGKINSITLHCKCAAGSGGTSYAKAAIYVASTLYYGDEAAITASWSDVTKQWTTNPATSVAWTWPDLDALEIGIALKYSSGTNANCTQVYVVIDYTVVGGSYACAIGL